MQTLAAFVAWRYLRHKEKDTNIAVMVKICFLGIAIGTFALMLTLIITNGFEKVIHEKMRGINAQIIISSHRDKINVAAVQAEVIKQTGAALAGISATSIKQVIMDHHDQQNVLFLKGIDPIKENTVTTLAQKITQPTTPRSPEEKNNLLKTLLQPKNIIIGYKTAQTYGLSIGQAITILIPEPASKKRIALRSQKVVIAGIFNIGLEEYDSNLAFIALETLNEFFDEQGADQIIIKLTNDTDAVEKNIINQLSQRMPQLSISSWKDLYPAIVASLKLEKYAMFFILALISLVACMNMISLLFMHIHNKIRDIGILSAMGMTSGQIRSIFMLMGFGITLSASLTGLSLAAITGYLIERYPVIALPDVYYVSYLPARLDFEIFIVVFVVTLLLGLVATLIPVMRSTKMHVADIVRQ